MGFLLSIFFMEQLALSNVGLVLSINIEFLCTFPWETITSKMTVTAGLLIDWLTQIEFSAKKKTKTKNKNMNNQKCGISYGFKYLRRNG